MSQKTITRREFLSVSATAAAGVALAACGRAATPAATQAPAKVEPTTAPVAPASKYKEAPMLADLVKAGKLPPVDQRLPKNPCIMTGYEGVGKYGGTWRRAFNGVSDAWGPTKIVDRGWGWFDAKLTLQPRILESWSVTPDGKEWTIKLREGMKWSDGKADYTTDDIAWWYKNELQNKKVSAALPTPWTNPDKSFVVFAAMDKLTAKFTYNKPKPMFIANMSRGGANTASPVCPSHYLKEKHEDTTSDKAALEAEWKKAGSDSWATWYLNFPGRFIGDPNRPALNGWLAMGALSKEMFVMQRNPYFFGVDKDGQQLPYIDKITHRLFESQEVKNLWVTNGEIDFQYRHMLIADLALYKSGEAKGDYKTVMSINAGHVAIQLNLSTKNKLLNEFFNQRNVRIAISQAINRDQINQLIYNGLLKPRQYSPLPMSPQYYEKLSSAYIKYDPDTANKLLDEAGYSKKGADGIRLHKDGTTPISFIIEGTDQTGTPGEDQINLVSKDLAKVGIKATYKYAERALYTTHYTANDIEAASWGGDRTVLPIVPEAIIFRGVQPDRPWCPGWGFWYLDQSNPNAVKPPEGHWIYNIWKIWDEEVVVEPDPVKQTAAFKKLLDIWATELPDIGLLGEQPTPTIVKNGFKGYPAGMPNDDTTGDEQFCQSETYYWDDPSKHSG